MSVKKGDNGRKAVSELENMTKIFKFMTVL